MTPEEILFKYWKFNHFRAPQEEIINTVLKKQDVLALLPTGAGKSLCFQIPALSMPGICIVISPLIALMQDQVDSLQEKGIKAMMLSSKFSFEETIIAFDNLRFGNYKFLYLSPEKLQTELIREKIRSLPVNLIAVDEAHCISEWGHDFRPSYLKINILQEIFPDVKTIALTATATQRVLEDIQKYLHIDSGKVFRKSFYRDNLQYKVIKTEDILYELQRTLQKNKNTAIVYVNTRRSAVNISNYLNRQKIRSVYYHGGLTSDEKKQALNRWKEEPGLVMVSTNAFGMGIDKADVRNIIHISVPQSLENYVQETGRAGRDGKPANALLFYNEHTLYDFKTTLENGLATVDICRDVYVSLNKYYEIALGERPERIFDFNLQEFCSVYEFPVINTFNALMILENEGIIEYDQTVDKRSVVKVTASKETLFAYQERNPSQKMLLQNLLRTYGGILDQFIRINEYNLSKRLQLSKKNIIQQLKQMNKDNILKYKGYDAVSKISFLVPREDQFTINRIAKHIENRNLLKRSKAKAVIEYIRNDQVCRYGRILGYFGEKADNFSCGKCDVCRKKKGNEISLQSLADEILDLFINTKTLNSREIIEKLGVDKKSVLKTLQLLLDNETLHLNSQNKFFRNK
jgi:ATP-dependent DNA helicase RecQ